MGRRITGVIFSDLGEGSYFMALDWVQRALREKLGFSPYPATLNLRLDPEDIPVWREIKGSAKSAEIPSPKPTFCAARCFPAEIGSKVRGAVIVPGVAGYPEDKIEVIAPVRVKDELRVKDGDRIALEFLS